MERIIETRYVKMWIEDGILVAVYAEDTEMDLSAAKQVVEARFKISEGKSYPCLVDMRGIKSVTKEARVFLADEGAKQIIAAAMITGNVFTRTLAHIFLTIDRPPVATRLFGEIAPAKEWLMQFVREKGSSDPKDRTLMMV